MNIQLLLFGSLLVVFISAIVRLYHHYYFCSHPIIPNEGKFSLLCNNQSQILLLQREQILKARLAIFGKSHHGYLSKSSNLQFYKHSFGQYYMKLHGNKKGFNEIVYHRIFKSGNNNIRTLIYNFAHLKYYNKLSSPLLDCVPDCTFSYKLSQSRFFPILFDTIYPKVYFSFTFVREPILRFISAVNEVLLS